jgi:hypothetical protein
VKRSDGLRQAGSVTPSRPAQDLTSGTKPAEEPNVGLDFAQGSAATYRAGRQSCATNGQSEVFDEVLPAQRVHDDVPRSAIRRPFGTQRSALDWGAGPGAITTPRFFTEPIFEVVSRSAEWVGHAAGALGRADDAAPLSRPGG